MKRLSAMQHDDGDAPPPPYSGPWIKFDGDGFTYRAWIEPPIAGDGLPRTFGSRHEGWWQVLVWAGQYRLPVRDLTDRNANKLREE